LREQCHKSKFVNFQERILKILKCYNFLWVQRRHNCSPAASFANRVMTLYLLKVRQQTFLSIPVTQKCQIFSCETLVANELYAIRLEMRVMICFITTFIRFVYFPSKNSELCYRQYAWYSCIVLDNFVRL
jgi:hypothetical protein